MKPTTRWFPPSVFVVLLASAAWVGRRSQEPELTTHAVAGSVYMLEGDGGNIGVCVGPDGVIVIDDKFARHAQAIEAAVDALSEGPVRFLLNTHWHGDHTGANAHFGAQGIPILAHANVRARLAGAEGVEGRKNADTPAAALPSLTYEDGVTLHFNGEQIDVLHFKPAHTDGDSVVYFNTSNVIHMGDLYFNGRFPYIDLQSGGSVQGLIESVGAVADSLDEGVRIIPGHGPISDLPTLRAYHAMLVECAARVSTALAAGKDAEAMKGEGLLDDYAGWDWAFIDRGSFIDTLARDLAGK